MRRARFAVGQRFVRRHHRTEAWLQGCANATHKPRFPGDPARASETWLQGCANATHKPRFPGDPARTSETWLQECANATHKPRFPGAAFTA